MDAARITMVFLVSIVGAVVGTDVLASEYVAIKARLTDTDQKYTYTVEQADRTFDLQTPSATFEIVSPETLSGRKVRILFHEGDLTIFFDESGNKIEGLYFLEIVRTNTELEGNIEVSDYQINRIEPASDGEDQ